MTQHQFYKMIQSYFIYDSYDWVLMIRMTPKNFLNLAESNCINNGYIRIRHYFLKSFGRHLTRIIHDEDGADRPTEALTP